MTATELSREEFAALAKEIYYRDIRPKVIDQHRGEFLVLDVESGDYEVDADMMLAEDRLQLRHPHSHMFGICVGYQAALTMGGYLPPDEVC